MKTVWTVIFWGMVSAATCFSQDLNWKSLNTGVGNSDDVSHVTSELGKINTDSAYFLLDSVAVFNYDATKGEWNPCLRKEIELNKEGQIASVIQRKYNPETTQWTNHTFESYKYDEYDEVSEKLVQEFDSASGKFINSTKKTILRTNGGQKITIRFSEWNKESNTWIAQWEQIQSFDSKGNPLRINTSQKAEDSDALQNYWQYVYLYDSNDELEMVFQYEWNVETNKWVDIWQSHYSKDNEGNVVTKLSEWNEADNAWSEFREYVTAVDDQISEALTIRRDWDEDKSAWTEKRRTSQYYLASDSTLHVIDEEWDDESANWSNRQSLKSVYNSKGVELERETAIWNKSTSTWSNDFKTSYHYTEVIIKDTPIEMVNDFYVYPNPAVDEVHLANVTERSILTILAVSGKVISKKVVDEMDATINVSNLKRGMYLFTLSNKHGEQTVKVLKK